jgi:prepilin-type N-terminal cleavage/methylation domain-containing protein
MRPGGPGRQSGFTLIELLVAMTIMLVVLAGATC